jgi:N-methylhydantoinase A
MDLRVGIDVGGTFADVVIVDAESGVLRKVVKIPTIADSLIKDIVASIKDSVPENETLEELVVLHGTTLGLNTLLQKRGAKTALITTAGFRDVYEIGRQWRGEDVYNLFYKPPTPLVPRHLIYEVKERIGSAGEVDIPLEVDQLKPIADKLTNEGVESVAVCLLFSFLNPSHEEMIGKWFQDNLPKIDVSLSCRIAPEFREYERTSTVSIDAYVKPTVRQYLYKFAQEFKSTAKKTDLYIMRSAGGLATVEEASDLPAQSLFSGPVGGVMGACHLSKTLGWSKVITLDMGGTSTDVALVIDGEPVLSKERVIEARPVNVPSVEVYSIGSGGGSIASTLAGRAIQVGPRSAGAIPGPACYGRGGTLPTLTDAWLALGHLEEGLLDGQLRLDRAKSIEAIEREVAKPLGMSAIEAASSIVDIAISQSYELMRLMTVERGHDPKEFQAVSFGGAGPVYTAAVARDLGVPTVCIPHVPGLFSAAGFLVSNLTRDFTKTRIFEMSSKVLPELNATWEELEGLARAREPGARILRFADLRYASQAYEVMVPAPAGRWDERTIEQAIESFHTAHERRFGMKAENERIQCVVFRVRAVLDLSKHQIEPVAMRERIATPTRARDAVFSGKTYSTKIFNRNELQPGDTADGPAIINEYDTTTVVYPEQRFQIDQFQNILIQTVIS